MALLSNLQAIVRNPSRPLPYGRLSHPHRWLFFLSTTALFRNIQRLCPPSAGLFIWGFHMTYALSRAQDDYDSMLPDDPPADPALQQLEEKYAQLLELIKGYQEIGIEAADKLDRVTPAGGQRVRRVLDELQEDLACVIH